MEFFDAITFRLKLAVLNVCFSRNMIWRKSAKVKYLFGQGVKDIWVWMVTLENKVEETEQKGSSVRNQLLIFLGEFLMSFDKVL